MLKSQGNSKLSTHFTNVIDLPVGFHSAPSFCKLCGIGHLETSGYVVHPGDHSGVVGGVVKQVPEQLCISQVCKFSIDLYNIIG